MKNLRKFLILLAVGNLSWLLVSCNQVLYAPTSHNVPLFREKKEIHVAGNFIGTDQAEGFEGQTAYSITDKFGVIANGSYLSGGNTGNGNYASGYLGEFGAGYFKPLGEHAVFETFAAGGFGQVTYPNEHPGPIRFPFQKYFIQPGIGYSGKFGDIAFTPKIALVRYKHGLFKSHEPDASGNYQQIVKHNYLAFEPAVTLRAGWKYAKIQVQVIRSYQEIPQANQTSVSLGLHLLLAPRFKTK